MPLTPAQRRQIEAALLAAFPTEADLAHMLLFQLNEHLTQVVRHASLQQMVFELVGWAETQGRLRDLVRGAVAENPTNPYGQALMAQIDQIPDQPTVPAGRVPFMAPAPPAGFVERPAEYDQLKRYLLDHKESGTVAISAALRGAGGYGKTTLAQALCTDADVRAAFPDGILWVELGQTPGNLAGRVQDWIYPLTYERPGFESVEAATAHLRALLAARTCLLVLDDVWEAAHTRPFLVGGPRCVSLITTRNRATLPQDCQCVDVDAMQENEAVQLLNAGLPPGEIPALHTLAGRLGRWPLLLVLINGALRSQVYDAGKSLPDACHFVTRLLDKRGLTAFDADNPVERNQAVAMTLRASLDLLTPEQVARFGELAVFPEDTAVPLTTLTRLWGGTNRYDAIDAEDLCRRLHQLSLLSHYAADGIRLHDVIRTYLLRQVPDPAVLHGRLVDTWGDLHTLPDAYSWTHVAYHLIAAERVADLRLLLLDYPWLRAKLIAVGSAALLADYEALPAHDSSIEQIQVVLRLAAHILARDPAQLPGQLWGRLVPAAAGEIAQLLAQAQNATTSPWLRPVRPSFTAAGGPLVQTLVGHQEPVLAVKLTQDGRRAVACSWPSTLKVWDLTSGMELLTIDIQSQGILGLALTPDDQRAICALPDGTLRVWDLHSGALLAVLTGHTGGVLAVTVTADGRWAVSAGQDRTVQVWDLAQYGTPRLLTRYSRGVRAVAVLPDDQQVLAGTSDGKLRIWDLANGTEQGSLREHSDRVTAVAVTPNGQRAVSASTDSTLKVWDLDRKAEAHTLRGHTHEVLGVAVTPDGRRAISASADHSLRVWDILNGRELGILRGHTGWVNAVAVHPDGQQVISASRDGTLRLWDLQNCSTEQFGAGHTDRVTSVTVTPDGHRAISASRDHTLKVWDVDQGIELSSLTGHYREVTAVATLPDGHHVISASADHTIRIWDLERSAEVSVLGAHDDPATAIAVLPDGQRAVSVGTDHRVRLWDLAQRQELGSARGHSAPVRAVAVSPDGQRILSGADDGSLVIWTLPDLVPLRTVQAHAAQVNAVAVTPDSKLAVSASADGTLKVWDVLTGVFAGSLRGHMSVVAAMVVTRDGQRAVSVAADSTVRIWDTVQRQLIAGFSADTPLWSCAITPDGHTIVVGDALGRVHFLRLENA